MLKQIFSLELALRAASNTNNNLSIIPTTSNSQQSFFDTKTSSSNISQTKIISDIFLPKTLNNNPIFLNANFDKKETSLNYSMKDNLENNNTPLNYNICSNIDTAPSSPNINDNRNSKLELTSSIINTTSNNYNTVCKKLIHKNMVCPCISCILGSSTKTPTTGATRRKPSINQIRKMSEPLNDKPPINNI